MDTFTKDSRWKRAVTSRVSTAAAAAVAALLVAGTLAVAAESGGDSGVIHACVKSSTGVVRIVASDGDCKSGERYITWNQSGPEGTPGEQGPAGELALAGQACPPGEFVTGFDTQAHLVCAVPDGTPGPVDADGDGYAATPGPDCNDNDPTVNPGATEVRDYKDNNCDGGIDEGLVNCDDGDPNTIDFYNPNTGACYYIQNDGDFDDDGYTATNAGGTDCNDDDPWVHSGVEEFPDDFLDNNCDGVTDEPTPSALNETNSSEEADYCATWHPSTMFVERGQLTEPVFGRVSEFPLTGRDEAQPGVLAELGFGPHSSDPRSTPGWSFVEATFVGSVNDGEDEYSASIQSPPRSGAFNYAYRVSFDNGASYTYCDLNGAGQGSGPSFDFDYSNLGTLSVS